MQATLQDLPDDAIGEPCDPRGRAHAADREGALGWDPRGADQVQACLHGVRVGVEARQCRKPEGEPTLQREPERELGPLRMGHKGEGVEGHEEGEQGRAEVPEGPPLQGSMQNRGRRGGVRENDQEAKGPGKIREVQGLGRGFLQSNQQWKVVLSLPKGKQKVQSQRGVG